MKFSNLNYSNDLLKNQSANLSYGNNPKRHVSICDFQMKNLITEIILKCHNCVGFKIQPRTHFKK